MSSESIYDSENVVIAFSCLGKRALAADYIH